VPLMTAFMIIGAICQRYPHCGTSGWDAKEHCVSRREGSTLHYRGGHHMIVGGTRGLIRISRHGELSHFSDCSSVVVPLNFVEAFSYIHQQIKVAIPHHAVPLGLKTETGLVLATI